MKKLFLLAVVIAASMLACTSCTKKTQVNATQTQEDGAPVCNESGCPMPKVTTNQDVRDVIAEENWQFTLTGPDWVPNTSLANIQAQDPSIKVVFQNTSNHAAVIFVKDATPGNQAAWVIMNMRVAVGEGAKIKSATQTTIGSDKYTLLDAVMDETEVWSWLLVKDGYGYALTCGGDEPADAGTSIQSTCANVALSLQIK